MKIFIKILAVLCMISVTVTLAKEGGSSAAQLDRYSTDPLNATYLIEGQAVRLTAGYSKLPAAPGSAMKYRCLYLVFAAFISTAAVYGCRIYQKLRPFYDVSFAFHGTTGSSVNEQIDDHFRVMNFRNPIASGASVSGFIFANRDEGIKVVDIDLISYGKAKFFATILRETPTFLLATVLFWFLTADPTRFSRLKNLIGNSPYLPG